MKRPASEPIRLTDVRRGSYASGRATERLLRLSREEELPSAISRTSQWRARAEACRTTDLFGPLVTDFTLPCNSGDVVVAVQQPAAMLHAALTDCAPFRTFFTQVCNGNASSESNPWHLVMYRDEIGHNPVGQDNRKCEAIYWSFAEFGPIALQTEACWFKICVCRSSLVMDVDGHMSRVFKLLLHQFFFGGYDFSNGVLPYEGIMLFAMLGFFIADEKALKEVLYAKGGIGVQMLPRLPPMFVILRRLLIARLAVYVAHL